MAAVLWQYRGLLIKLLAPAPARPLPFTGGQRLWRHGSAGGGSALVPWRVWLSAPALAPKPATAHIPPAVAVAACKLETSTEAKFKWSNDLLARDGKLAGCCRAALKSGRIPAGPSGWGSMGPRVPERAITWPKRWTVEPGPASGGPSPASSRPYWRGHAGRSGRRLIEALSRLTPGARPPADTENVAGPWTEPDGSLALPRERPPGLAHRTFDF